jgi:kinesin family protein 18/19
VEATEVEVEAEVEEAEVEEAEVEEAEVEEAEVEGMGSKMTDLFPLWL